MAAKIANGVGLGGRAATPSSLPLPTTQQHRLSPSRRAHAPPELTTPCDSEPPPPPLPHITSLALQVDYGECFRVYNNPNITVHFNTETVDVVSNTKGQMAGILVRKVDTGEESVLEAKGSFYGIGHSPNSQFLEGQIELDSSGYVLVKEGTANTSVEGVFAAGDVQVCLKSYGSSDKWFMDSACSRHMTGDKSKLSSFTPKDGGFVTFGDNSRGPRMEASHNCSSFRMHCSSLSVERYLSSNYLLVEFHQPKTEEVKKELTGRDVQEGFDITLTKHKGQYALRKLYHESPRLMCVLYTAPTCGLCRTLKPILSKDCVRSQNEERVQRIY